MADETSAEALILAHDTLHPEDGGDHLPVKLASARSSRDTVELAIKIDAFRAVGAPQPDDPEADATDAAAHPAWWRGNDAGVAVTVARLTDILDGKDDGEGVIGYAPLEALRRRLLVLATKPDPSDAYTSARVLLKLREIQSRPDYSGDDEADCIANALAEARAAGVARTG